MGAYASHPHYGTYDYHKMVKAFMDQGFVVISEIRPQGTDKLKYANKVVQQINTLLVSGVAAKNITVAGFSKGGSIALYVSAILKNPNIKYVVMAGCGRTGEYKRGYEHFLRHAASSLQGHFLSIYDENDSICGTCKSAFNAATGKITSNEIKLKVGKGHGTYYTPRKEWLEPVVEWINRPNP